MKNKQLTWLASILAIVLMVSFSISCKKKFDEPPYPTDPNITANTTIKALKAIHTAATGSFEQITTDMIISGVVIADDKSGNLYKNIYIQDATGAINVLLDASGLYGTFPVGRRVFIYCKGLYLSDYRGLIQLGVKSEANGITTMEGIPSALISKYVVGGSIGNTVTPKLVSLSTLTTGLQDPYIGDLIRLDNQEVIKGDTSKFWADTSAYKNSANITITDCSGAQVIVRSSGYANFGSVKPPRGNGSIYAIYTVFGTTKQLVIRDTSDVKFTSARCNLFEEDFNNYAVTGTAPLVLTGWKNIMETGDVPYTLASFSGSVFPKVSAFTSAQMPTTNISSWLITPDVTIPSTLTTAKLSFTCSRKFTAGTFKAYISTNYTGGAPSAATWTLLTTVPAGTATAFTPFDLFGPFSLTSYAGQKVNIGFRYEAPAGTAASLVGTYEVDDIKISKN